MKPTRVIIYLAWLVILVGCNYPTPEVVLPTSTQLLSSPSPRASATSPVDTPRPTMPRGSEEAILILEPGPGSRLTSPLRVAGVSDPTFEQTLVVRIVLDEGTELAIQPVIIAADIGHRGAFEVEIPFTVSGERNALVQVLDQSARDGGIIHLASVGVTLAATGANDVLPGASHPETIVIYQPELGDTVVGGIAYVEGFGLASFEQTLILEIHDAEGNVVGSLPIMVDAADWGLPGPFNADVPYAVAEEGPGRVVVIDPLPVFDGVGHISSVEVTLAP